MESQPTHIAKQNIFSLFFALQCAQIKDITFSSSGYPYGWAFEPALKTQILE
jgi:hypothetical protein